MQSKIYVINSRGERKPFSSRKVCRSARRVGATPSFAEEIARTIKKEAYPEIRTSEIFKRVKKMLKKEKPGSALKFSLKKAMRRLGPTGFPFEKYIGEILSRSGYDVKLNRIIPGHCCSYEIDFLAKKDNILYVGECKYRNLAGGVVHSDIALANYARFIDIEQGNFLKKKSNHYFEPENKIKSILVTNTKFTSRAVRYSECVGVNLLGWNYPKNEGLERLIDQKKLYPITILDSLKQYMSSIFVEKRMMLVHNLLEIDPEKFSKENKIPKNHLLKVIGEARVLIKE